MTDDQKIAAVTAKLIGFKPGDRVRLNPPYIGTNFGTIVDVWGMGASHQWKVRPDGFSHGFAIVRVEGSLELVRDA